MSPEHFVHFMLLSLPSLKRNRLHTDMIMGIYQIDSR